MRLWTLYLTWMLALTLRAGPCSAAPDALLNDVLDKIRAVQTVRAEFSEETLAPASARSSVHGTFVSRAPDSTRRTSYAADGALIADEIDDGTAHWAIDPHRNATKTIGGLHRVKPIAPLFASSLFSCLDCPAQPWLRYVGKTACGSEECFVFQHGQYFEWVGCTDGLLRRLTVCQFSESSRIHGVTVADLSTKECDAQSRTEYRNVRVNAALDDDPFRYDPPEGATVTEIDRRPTAPVRKTWVVRGKLPQLSAAEQRDNDDRLTAVKRVLGERKTWVFGYLFKRDGRAGRGSYLFKAPQRRRITLSLSDNQGSYLYGRSGEREWRSSPPAAIRAALLSGESTENSPLAQVMAVLPSPLTDIAPELIRFQSEDRIGDNIVWRFEVLPAGKRSRMSVWVSPKDGIARKIVEYGPAGENAVFDVVNVKTDEDIDDAQFVRTQPVAVRPSATPTLVRRARKEAPRPAAEVDAASEASSTFAQFCDVRSTTPTELRGGGVKRALSRDLYLRFVSLRPPLLRRGVSKKDGDLDQIAAWFAAELPEDKTLLNERTALELAAVRTGEDGGLWLLHHKSSNTWFFRSWRRASTTGD